MKKRFVWFCAVFVVLALSFISGTARAADVEYTGIQPLTTDIPLAGADDARGNGSVVPVDSSGNPIASDNTVTVTYSDGPVPWRVFGGLSDNAEVRGNTAILEQGNVANNFYGGYDAATSSGFNAVDNKISISGGSIIDNAIAGISLNGDVTGNSVTMSGGQIGARLYGGSANSNGDAVNNTVKLAGGEVTQQVYGGYSEYGSSTGNKISIMGGNAAHNVLGGYTSSNGNGDVLIILRTLISSCPHRFCPRY